MSTKGTAIDRMKARKNKCPMPRREQWDWIRSFIQRGVKNTNLDNLTRYDLREARIALQGLDAFTRSHFGNRWETELAGDLK
jgi:hypothetical protein